MAKRLIFHIFIIISGAYFMANCTAFGRSEPPAGNADSGVCSNTLMDRKLLENRQAFWAEDLAIYTTDIKPILNATQGLPKFYQALKKVLGYRWRFAHSNADFEKIKNCPTQLSHQVTDYKKVACQTAPTDETPGEVLIDPIWYKTVNCKPGMSNSSAIQARKEKQRDLFVHELLLGITLGTDISADASSEVFRVLTRQPIPTIDEIQGTLESSGFGIFGTSAHSDCLHVESKPSVNAETLAKSTRTIASELNKGTGEPIGFVCSFDGITGEARSIDAAYKKLQANRRSLFFADDEHRNKKRMCWQKDDPKYSGPTYSCSFDGNTAKAQSIDAAYNRLQAVRRSLFFADDEYDNKKRMCWEE
jgi:hypothetical protein